MGIRNLSVLDSVSSGDQIPVLDESAGVDRRMSVSQLMTYFSDNFASPDVTVTISSPIAGFNQALPTSTTSIWLLLTPAGTLATGTVTLPAVADLFDGQEVLVTSSAVITALTVAGNGATVNGAPGSLAANGFFRLRYNTLLTSWFCVAQSLGGTTNFTDITITNAILDAASNELVKFVSTTSAVNEVTIVNGATGTGAGILATGGDTNVDLLLSAKGTGKVYADGSEVVTYFSANTLQGQALSLNIATDMTLVVPIIDISTVVALPAAAVGLRGARATVTNAVETLAAGIGLAPTNGGANCVPVFCNGVAWLIG